MKSARYENDPRFQAILEELSKTVENWASLTEDEQYALGREEFYKH